MESLPAPGDTHPDDWRVLIDSLGCLDAPDLIPLGGMWRNDFDSASESCGWRTEIDWSYS